MNATLDCIVRHPLKAIGREELSRTILTRGQWLPMDRVWAVAHERSKLDQGWVPKANFLRGVTEPKLMAIACVWNESLNRLTLVHPKAGQISICPDSEADTSLLLDWLSHIWPEDLPQPTGIYRAADANLTDTPDPWISINSLASNHDLSQRLGQNLSIHRWRGNLWIEGLTPWEEKSWVGKDIQVGEAVLRVQCEITRCKATMANPDTGRRDVDTLGALQALGHQEFGVYAEVIRDGEIVAGDAVEVAT
ncbi:MAG: MOSC domain-containing protein [Boseongicola sp. SB0675_bin_26]|nr:MOSC domain-containing protein [Boseongicola sp. SB0675_bin_26]